VKNIFFFILLTTLAGCSNGPKDAVFHEISYGICKVPDFIPFDSEDSPSGNYRYGASTKIVTKTDTIPAILNSVFGISYQVDSKTNEEIVLEKIWIPPTEIIDDNGKKFKKIKVKSKTKTNKLIYSYYFLEKEYEIIKGEWIVQFFFDGKKLHERKFFLK